MIVHVYCLLVLPSFVHAFPLCSLQDMRYMIFIKLKMILYTPSRATKSGAARCFRTEPQFPELSPLHG